MRSEIAGFWLILQAELKLSIKIINHEFFSANRIDDWLFLDVTAFLLDLSEPINLFL